MQKVTAAEGIELPAAGQYGVGAVYGSPDPVIRLPTVGSANEHLYHLGMANAFIEMGEIPNLYKQ